MSVTKLTKYAKEHGFEPVRQNAGHLIFHGPHGLQFGVNKRPNSVSPGLLHDIMKIIEKADKLD